VGNLPQPGTVQVELEEAPDNDRLRLVDDESAPCPLDRLAPVIHRGGDGAIAVREAPGGESALGSPEEPAKRVGPELLPVLLVEDAHHLRADVEDVEPGLDEHGGLLRGREAVSDPAQVFDVAREPGRVPRQENVPLVQAGDQAEERRTVVSRRAGEPGLFDHERVEDLPTPGGREGAAARDLIRRRVGRPTFPGSRLGYLAHFAVGGA